VLVGRSREIEAIRGLLEDARAGRGRALLLRGPPGIGKSTLLELARREGGEGGMRVLAARGAASESQLAFAALSDVLRPVLDRLEEVPDAQRAALRAALALGPPAVPDRFAAYAATLTLLGALTAEGPVLLLVDDGHWLDPPSREALAFCARRIADEPIAILAASRERPPERLLVPDVEELEVRPLDREESAALLESLTRSDPLAPGVAREILALARGNPLALVELPGALSPGERAGSVALPRPLRPGGAIVDAYRRRVEGLDPGARRALAMAAVSHDGAAGPIADALARLGGGTGDLVAAESAGFLGLDGGVVRLRHPLLRPVVLELMDPAERRDAHRALAAALDPDRDVEQRAWHLAEAAVGPDDVVAAALEAAATLAAGRTGYATGATLLEKASSAARDPVRAGGDLLGAAKLAMAAGDPARGASIVERLWQSGPEPPIRAETAHLRGLVTLMTASTDDAFALLVSEARTAREADPIAAAEMLSSAGLSRAMAGRFRESLRCLQEARLILVESGGRSPYVAAMLASALTVAGRAREAREAFAALDAFLDQLEPLTPQGQSLVIALTPTTWLGDFERAARYLSRWTGRARESGSLAFLGFPQAFGAELDLRRGRWRDAEARGIEAVRSLEETGQHGGSLGFALITLATIEAGLGRADDCREHARRARELAEGLGLGSIVTYHGFALGLLEQGLGRPAAALAHLEPLVESTRESGLREPATVMWQPDLVEAYVRLGRLGDARRTLATLAEQADRTEGIWARAATRRCRGLIDDDIDRHFGEALALHARLPMPFEQARTELLYGARLRRAGRRAEARTHLESALAAFDELGAEPWAAQAREEIAAGGAPLRERAAPRSAEELSPRELQVARSVARGLTNREAAARMFLSEKTIERHLGSVYRKLGLRSRTELARRLAREDDAPHRREGG
jgi:DNA-binding NarL/FixJ family response regulator